MKTKERRRAWRDWFLQAGFEEWQAEYLGVVMAARETV